MARDFGRLSHIFNRVDKLSPQKRQLLAATLSGAAALGTDRDVLARFYDGLPGSNSGPPESARFLTYAPFAEVLPGFSWILFLGAPHLCPEHATAALKAQLTMRDALFRQVDFAACRNVLDFGCGYGSDLIRLAERHPHLQLDGYTISPRQAEIAREAVRARHLEDRVRIFCRDSASVPFPTEYDLAFGFEVAHHIHDKAALFRNISNHLRDDAFLVMADFISHTMFPIEDRDMPSSFPQAEEWTELLSDSGLQVTGCVDTSKEIANFLFDPEFEKNLRRFRQFNPDASVSAAFSTYHNGGELLRKKLASYVLFTARKQQRPAAPSLRALNRDQLQSLTLYEDLDHRRWLYRLDWEPRPLSSASVESPASGAAVAFDDLARGYVARAFDQLGFVPAAGESAEDAVDRLGIAQRQRRLFSHLASVRGKGGAPSPEILRRELAERFGECHAELDLLNRCGAHLTEVLRGEIDPLTLLFPNGDLNAMMDLYSAAPAFRAPHAPLHNALRRELARIPSAREIRILELGAGTGATTAGVLPLFGTRRIRYVFTDISPLFLSRAREIFGERAGFEALLLDIEKDPASQGFDEPFDIVIASNVLHATSSLRETLKHVRRLVTRDGRLLLVEGSAPRLWIDLIFGLLEGWWRFEDRSLRPAYPLLSGQHWASLLHEAGFHNATASAAEEESYALFSQNLIAAYAARRADRWLIVGERSQWSLELADAIRVRGAFCSIAAEVESPIPDGLCGVVYLEMSESSPDDIGAAGRGALAVVQRLVSQPVAPMPQLWFVTSGITASSLSGMAKVAVVEHPELHIRCIDLDPTNLPDEIQRVPDELFSGTDDDQIVYRSGERRVARLARTFESAPPPEFRANATYLITGGTGGLGLLTARWMAGRGARNVVLAARNAPGPEARAKIAQIELLGARVHIRQADLSHPEEASALFAELSALPQLRGIVHATGVLHDGALSQITSGDLDIVMNAKALAAWQLHTLTSNRPLDFFVMYSSIVSILGNAGQAAHAAANAFLDWIAAHRKANGLPGLSLNWGPWGQIGSAAGNETGAAFRARGIERIQPDDGLNILDRCFGMDVPQLVVAPITWELYFRGMPILPCLSHLREGRLKGRRGDVARPLGPVDLSRKLAEAAEDERPILCLTYMKDVAARALGFDDIDFDAGRPLSQMGLDSLMAIAMRNRIRNEIGVDIPMSRFMAGSTIRSLSDEVISRVGEAAPLSAAAAVNPAGDSADVLLANLDRFTDFEVEQMLQSLSPTAGGGNHA